MEIVFLNWRLNDATLCPTIRKPFDVLAERLLVSSSRGDRTSIELLFVGVRGWERKMQRRLDDGRPNPG
jgi:hypothetical protein